MDLDALFNNLLSGGIDVADQVTARKLKALNGFHLVFVMMAPLLGLFYFYIGAIFLFYVSIIAGVLMIASFILLRKTQSITGAGNCAIFVLWATLFLMTWYTGPITQEGVIKPSLIMNGGLILLAVFFLGYLWGAAWTIIVFVETGIIVYLFRIHYPFPNLIPAEISEIYALGTYLLALLILFVFAFLYEMERMEAFNHGRKNPQDLNESKSYLEGVLDGIPIPTFILDRNHHVTQWNDACRQLTGVRAEEIIGRRAWEGFRVQENGSIADVILKDPGSFKPVSDKGWFELEMFFPNLNGGQQAIVTAAQVLDNKGNVIGAIQTVQEVGDPVQGNESADGDSHLSDESFADPTFKMDLQGLISFWNQACEDQFGYSSSEILGKSSEPLIYNRFKADFKKTIADVLNGASYTNKEWIYNTLEGKQIYVLAKAYPLRSPDKRSLECVIVSRNITELKVKQRKLKLYASESKEKLKSLTEEYDLLKKNVASFIREKNGSG